MFPWQHNHAPPFLPLPPAPWAVNVHSLPTSTEAAALPDTPAFTNPATADRAAQLAACIDELHAELLVSRAFHGS
jgi:hypothetical protein